MTFKQLQWAGVCVALVSILVVLLYKLAVAPPATNDREIVVAVCIAAVLFVLSPNIGRLKSISVAGLKAELRQLRKKTAQNRAAGNQSSSPPA